METLRGLKAELEKTLREDAQQIQRIENERAQEQTRQQDRSHPERRPARRHPHKRILRSNAGPGLPYAAQNAVIAGVMHQFHAIIGLISTSGNSRPQRMKRVRYPDEPPHGVSKVGS